MRKLRSRVCWQDGKTMLEVRWRMGMYTKLLSPRLYSSGAIWTSGPGAISSRTFAAIESSSLTVAVVQAFDGSSVIPAEQVVKLPQSR